MKTTSICLRAAAASLLFLAPVTAQSQFDILKKAKQTIEERLPSVESLFGNGPVITTNIEDAHDGVALLDGFTPRKFSPLLEGAEAASSCSDSAGSCGNVSLEDGGSEKRTSPIRQASRPDARGGAAMELTGGAIYLGVTTSPIGTARQFVHRERLPSPRRNAT
jgi:hypothetical protein